MAVACRLDLSAGQRPFGSLTKTQQSSKQLKALGIGWTVVVLMAKMQVEPHPFLVVPPLFRRNLPGREDLAVSRIRGRESAHA